MKSGSKRAPKPTRTLPRKTKVEVGSGNVFADLGLPNPEELLARAQMVVQIKAIITQRKLTQEKAAAILGIDQPKVSALLRGKLSGFSTERLFRFLNALGQNVEIVIRSAGPREARGVKVRATSA